MIPAGTYVIAGPASRGVSKRDAHYYSVQSAIDRAAELECDVALAFGVYRIREPIVVPGGVRLFGSGEPSNRRAAMTAPTVAELNYALNVFLHHGIDLATASHAASSVGIEEGASTAEMVVAYAAYLESRDPDPLLGQSGHTEYSGGE